MIIHFTRQKERKDDFYKSSKTNIATSQLPWTINIITETPLTDYFQRNCGKEIKKQIHTIINHTQQNSLIVVVSMHMFRPAINGLQKKHTDGVTLNTN